MLPGVSKPFAEASAAGSRARSWRADALTPASSPLGREAGGACFCFCLAFFSAACRKHESPVAKHLAVQQQYHRTNTSVKDLLSAAFHLSAKGSINEIIDNGMSWDAVLMRALQP